MFHVRLRLRRVRRRAHLWLRWCAAVLIYALVSPLVLVWLIAYWVTEVTESCLEGPVTTAGDLMDDDP